MAIDGGNISPLSSSSNREVSNFSKTNTHSPNYPSLNYPHTNFSSSKTRKKIKLPTPNKKYPTQR